jgi:hypothetical protein
MRNLNINERVFIANLYSACFIKPVPVENLLEKLFFTRKTGRSMILQPAGRFGYFYLPVPHFDNETARNDNFRKLIEILAMLKFLRDEGLLILFEKEQPQEDSMRFIGQIFDKPRAEKKHIELNPGGDYTFEPDCIRNINDDVIFRGIFITRDLFSLADCNTRGMIYAVPEMKDFLIQAVQRTMATTLLNSVKPRHLSEFHPERLAQTSQ